MHSHLVIINIIHSLLGINDLHHTSQLIVTYLCVMTQDQPLLFEVLLHTRMLVPLVLEFTSLKKFAQDSE